MLLIIFNELRFKWQYCVWVQVDYVLFHNTVVYLKSVTVSSRCNSTLYYIASAISWPSKSMTTYFIALMLLKQFPFLQHLNVDWLWHWPWIESYRWWRHFNFLGISFSLKAQERLTYFTSIWTNLFYLYFNSVVTLLIATFISCTKHPLFLLVDPLHCQKMVVLVSSLPDVLKDMKLQYMVYCFKYI